MSSVSNLRQKLNLLMVLGILAGAGGAVMIALAHQEVDQDRKSVV